MSMTTMGVGRGFDDSIEMGGMREIVGSLKDEGINTFCTLRLNLLFPVT